MFDLNYNELIKEKKVYFVMYGRGGILGVVDTPLSEPINYLENDIRDSHAQELLVVTDLEKIDDYLVIGYKYKPFHQPSKQVHVKRKIPLYQMTFESYGIIE